MTLPDTLTEELGDESPVAEVSLGGEDRLVVTPSRTLVYRAEGLLSDERIDEYPHDAERLDVTESRRKAKLVLDYGLDGDDAIAIPAKKLDEVLHPVLAGILSAAGITDAGESVIRTFRFSELTLVVTDKRLVKHIGSATWDQEFEEFEFADTVGLDFEEGTVATSVVMTLGDRQERFKVPNEQARQLRETLSSAVCSFHDVESLEEFRLTVTPDEPEEDGASPTNFESGLDPLSTSRGGDSDAADDETDASAGETPTELTSEVGSADAAGVSTDAQSGSSERNSGSIEQDSESATTHSGSRPTDSGSTAADSGSTTADSGSTTAEVLDRTGDGTVSADTPATEKSASEGTADTDGATDATTDTGTTTDDAGGDDVFGETGFESAIEDPEVAEELAQLRAAVEEQSRRLDSQAELIEQLVEELRRGR